MHRNTLPDGNGIGTPLYITVDRLLWLVANSLHGIDPLAFYVHFMCAHTDTEIFLGNLDMAAITRGAICVGDWQMSTHANAAIAVLNCKRAKLDRNAPPSKPPWNKDVVVVVLSVLASRIRVHRTISSKCEICMNKLPINTRPIWVFVDD